MPQEHPRRRLTFDPSIESIARRLGSRLDALRAFPQDFTVTFLPGYHEAPPERRAALTIGQYRGPDRPA